MRKSRGISPTGQHLSRVTGDPRHCHDARFRLCSSPRGDRIEAADSCRRGCWTPARASASPACGRSSDTVGYTGPAARAALGAELGPSYRRWIFRSTWSGCRATPLKHADQGLRLFLWIERSRATRRGRAARTGRARRARCVERRRHRSAPRWAVARSDVLLAHDRYDPGPGSEPGPRPGCERGRGDAGEPDRAASRPLALDLGCGGGIQALFAARHSEHVDRVDKNPGRSTSRDQRAAQRAAQRRVPAGPTSSSRLAGLRFDLIV